MSGAPNVLQGGIWRSTVIATWVLFNIGARVYAGAVLQTAGRMKLRDAWWSAGE